MRILTFLLFFGSVVSERRGTVYEITTHVLSFAFKQFMLFLLKCTSDLKNLSTSHGYFAAKVRWFLNAVLVA
jgi:hypothetical protein